MKLNSVIKDINTHFQLYWDPSKPIKDFQYFNQLFATIMVLAKF